MSHAPTLLLLHTSPSAESVLLYPWQQEPIARIELDLHAQKCETCSIADYNIFDMIGTRHTVVVACPEGKTLATTLLAKKDRVW
jgi:hypothetical protein